MQDMKNPAGFATGEALKLSSLSRADNFKNSSIPTEINEIRAAFIARRCGVSREIAMIVAPLAFGLEVTP
jgi:hypothetical protein